jgi:tetratricopeptide (TPR) repeat protein
MNAEADEAVRMASAIEPSSTRLYQEMARLSLRSSLSAALGRELKVPAAAVEPAVDELDPAEVLESQLREHAAAVAEHPDYPDYRYRYGLLLKCAGRADDALTELRQAVALNPTYVKALVKLGLTAWEAGRLQEAADALRRAVDLAPEYVDLHYRLGLVYADRGLWPMAVEEYRQALARQPNADGVEASLVLALENMGLAGEEALPFAEAAKTPGV